MQLRQKFKNLRRPEKSPDETGNEEQSGKLMLNLNQSLGVE